MMDLDRKLKRFLRQATSKLVAFHHAIDSAPTSVSQLSMSRKPTTFSRRKPRIESSSIEPSLGAATALIDHFIHEILRKLVVSSTETFPSLLRLAASSVGRHVPFSLISLEIEDFELQESWYEAIPYHTREIVLLHHLIQLYLTHLNLPYIFQKLIDSCIDSKAYLEVQNL